MSMARGRAWTSLGQSLGNIGNLLLQNQELERERQRQAEQDRQRIEDRTYTRGRDAMADARQAERDALTRMESLNEMGATEIPASTPPIRLNLPLFGASFPGGNTVRSTGANIAAPPTGYLGAPVTMSAPLENVGRLALGAPTTPTVIRGLESGFQPTRIVADRRSPAVQEEIQKAEQAARLGDAYAGTSDAAGRMTPGARTAAALAGGGAFNAMALSEQREATAATRVETDAGNTLTVAEYKRLYPSLASFGDEEVMRRGYELATRHATSGGVGTGEGSGLSAADRRRLQQLNAEKTAVRTEISTLRAGFSADYKNDQTLLTAADSAGAPRVERLLGRLADLEAETSNLLNSTPPLVVTERPAVRGAPQAGPRSPASRPAAAGTTIDLDTPTRPASPGAATAADYWEELMRQPGMTADSATARTRSRFPRG